MPTRDAERQRCYDIESATFEGTSLEERVGLELLQGLAARVASTRWWGVEASGRSVALVTGRSATTSTSRPDGQVRLSARGHTVLTLAHELAHVAAGAVGAGHGSRWRACELAVLEMLAGDEAAERLRVAYRRAWLAIDDLAVAPDPCGRQGLAGGGVVRTGIVEEWVLKVRKLLAKAASTDSDAESAALRAKALELMERHRISAALVAGEEAGGEVVERTLLLGAGPYVSARFALLDALGRAHGCEVFWQTLAAGRLVHVAGHPTDVELVLAAHTLLANQALASLAAHRPRGNALAWRRAFLTGFAKEVSDRLEATHAGRRAGAYEGDDGRLDDADARSVALVLRARADALQQHMNAHHPRIRSVASRHLTSVSGYAAGREAGSRADLPGAVRLPKGRPALGA